MYCMLNQGLANPLGFLQTPAWQFVNTWKLHFCINVTLALYPLGPPSQLLPASSGGNLAYANVNTDT